MKTTGTLQGGMVAPAGVTAPEPEDPARISPNSKPHRPTGSKPTNQLAAHQHAPPRSQRHPRRLTEITTTRPRERGEEALVDGSSSAVAAREGTTSSAVVQEARASGTVAVAIRTRQ